MAEGDDGPKDGGVFRFRDEEWRDFGSEDETASTIPSVMKTRRNGAVAAIYDFYSSPSYQSGEGRSVSPCTERPLLVLLASTTLSVASKGGSGASQPS